MAQPPEDGSATPSATPNEPTRPDDATIAWTPPDLPPIDPATLTPEDAAPIRDDAPFEDPAPSEDPAANDDPAATEPAVAPPLEPEPGPAAEPSSPLISWAPSGSTPVAAPVQGQPAVPGFPSLPGVPGPSLPPSDPIAGPLVGWQQPVASAQAVAVDGYVVATTWARLVAYFIDSALVTIIPTILSVWSVDFTAMMREAIEASRVGAAGGVGATTFTTPLTLETALVTVVTVGLSFVYFVGFWTSGGQATLGMRGLRMRTADAMGRGGLSLGQAVRRWVMLGAPLSLLALIPALQSAIGFASIGLSLLLLITVATDDRRQGLHDKVAGSVVIRSVTSGAGATAVGCLVLVALAIVVGAIVSSFMATEMAPLLQDYLQELETAP